MRAVSTGSTAVRAEPNVAPMIDVMLVLLVIFMIVVPALGPGFAAEPPRGTNLRAHPEDGGDHTLGIDAGGQLYLDRQPLRRDELTARLARLYPAGASDRVLFVVAHRGLEYRVVRDAVADASSAGVRVVGMVTEAAAPGRTLPADARRP